MFFKTNTENIKKAKRQFIFSYLDNQIKKGNKILILSKNDYDFLKNSDCFYKKNSRIETYKGIELKVLDEII